MTPARPSAQRSLHYEISRVLVAAAMLPVLAFGLALLWTQWQRDRDDLVQRQQASAVLAANTIDDYLDGHVAGMTIFARVADEAAPALERLLDAYPGLHRVMRVGPEGRVLAYLDREPRWSPPPGSVASQEWFRSAIVSGSPQVSGVQPELAPGGGNTIVVSVPVRRAGQADGLLQASMPVEHFTRKRSEGIRRQGMDLLLVDRTGRVLHADPALRWHAADATGEMGKNLRQQASPPGVAGVSRTMRGLLDDDGQAFVNAVTLRSGWMLALVTPIRRVEAPAWPRLLLMLGLLGIALCGVLLALWRQRWLLSHNLGQVLASLRGYALGGTMDPRQMARMPQELQPLSVGIGELAARMNQAYAELQRVLEQRDQVIAERTESLRQVVTNLDRLSRTDALTGSLNYRGFRDATEVLWRDARASGQPLSVLALDIDHFKLYNDLYGHVGGDGALRRFTGAVRSALQGANDVLARPGGEEFTVFLPSATLEQAEQVGERICRRVRDADILHAASPTGRLTVSIGVASIEGDDVDPENMLQRADAALYRAKHAGRDRVSR